MSWLFSESDSLRRASSFVEREQFPEAIPILREILRRNPKQAVAQYLLGFCLHLSGHDEHQAFHHYRAGLDAGMAPYHVHMNAGILYAEIGEYGEAIKELRLAISKEDHARNGLLRGYIRQMEEFEEKATPAEKAAPYRPPLGCPEYTLGYLERIGAAQSMQFMVDCLPDIRRLFEQWPWGQIAEVLDVGASSGAGSNLLAMLHQEHYVGPKMKVTALDIKRTHRRYARLKFPLIEYRVGDVFQLAPSESWDLVFCSHTIEHIKDPTPFIQALQKRARHWAVFYAPYDEKALLPGHLISLTDEVIGQWKPTYIRIGVSPAWNNPSDKVSRTVLFALPGLYQSKTARVSA